MGQAKHGMMLEEFPKSTMLSKNEVPLMGNTIFATLPPLLFLKDVHIHPFNRPHDEDDGEECFPAELKKTKSSELSPRRSCSINSPLLRRTGRKEGHI